MTETTIRGKFLWHELLCADPKTAAEFYRKVIGWTTQATPHNPAYTLLVLPSGPLAGMLELPAEPGDRARWLPYIGTPDVRDTVAQCRDRGGVVHKDVTAIPDTGEFAVLADPQGAVFAVYTPSGASDGNESAAEIGEFSWHELATTDLAAFDFYQALFAWEQLATHNMGPMGTYLIFGRQGKPLGGMFKTMGADPAAPQWLSYVRVADADGVAAKVKAAGGQVANGPMEVPGGDWIAQCFDPEGAAFAVHALREAAEPAEPSTPTAAALAAVDDEFAATLVMERPSIRPARTKQKAKRKTRPASTPVKKAKTAKTVRSAAKKVKKPSAKTRVQAAAAKKSQKASKKARRAVVRSGKKATKRGAATTKTPPRKPLGRSAKTKKDIKRKNKK